MKRSRRVPYKTKTMAVTGGDLKPERMGRQLRIAHKGAQRPPHHLERRGVGPAHVVGIANEILSGDFPIAVQDRFQRRPEQFDAAAGREGFQIPRQVAEIFTERRGFGIEAAEHEPCETLDLRDRTQAEFRLVDPVVVRLFFERYVYQLTVIAKAVSVIIAGEGLCVAALGKTKLVAAMGTDVEECIEFPVSRANHDYRVLSHIGTEKIAGVRYLGLMGQEEPTASKGSLEFQTIDVIVPEDTFALQSRPDVNDFGNIHLLTPLGARSIYRFGT